MGKGWDRFKTILLNIFTEEVEVEIKEPKKKKQTKQSNNSNEPRQQTARVKSAEQMGGQDENFANRGLDEVKVERKTNAFRFPLIPDSDGSERKSRDQETYMGNRPKHKQGLSEKQRPQAEIRQEPVKRAHLAVEDSHIVQSSGSARQKTKTAAELQLERRLAEQEKRRLARRKGRRPIVQQSVGTSYERQYAAYEQEKALKQMDQVPAFVRRASEKEQEVVEDVNHVPPQKQEEVVDEPIAIDKSTDMMGQKEADITIYSTPDELDRIFKKKNQLQEEPVTSQSETYAERNGISEEVAVNPENEFANEVADNEPVAVTEAEPVVERKSIPLAERNQGGQRECEVTKQPVAENFHPPIKAVEIEKRTLPVYKQAEEEKQVVHDIPHYLLDDPAADDTNDEAWLEEQQFLLERTLTHFKIRAKVVHVTQGPTVTRFEIQPELGVKVSTIRNLADDLKLNLAAKEIRIEAPIPGKNTVGIEIPNAFPQMVTLQQIIETPDFAEAESALSIALGVTIEGDPLITNISKMPHGLIAGATGSGKSVCINTILLSLLYKANHEEVKFLLIDPKMVELAPYNGIPHLVAPVITDVKAATAALKWAVQEMEKRYERFVAAGVRNMEKYNEKVASGQLQDEKMPYIVIVIDELADLMMVSPQDVEDAICRIAQKARACGMHLLLATQRPSVDVITGLIKANIPTRIAFTVSSQVDSRTIMDTNGAEKLLGKGDMLFMENGSGRSLRLQGPFVSDEEIERVTAYMRQIAKPNYLFEQEQLLMRMEEEEQDELFEEVLLFVLDHNQASTSLLQRQFRIGYNRAARLIDTLHAQGVISAPNGAKPRDVLITYEQADEMFFTK